MVFKQDNNYEVGDNLIIKAEMNNRLLDEINSVHIAYLAGKKG